MKAIEEMGFKTETFTYATDPEQSPGAGKPEYVDLLGDLVDPQAITDAPRKGERKMFWKKLVDEIKNAPLMGDIDDDLTKDDDYGRTEWD